MATNWIPCTEQLPELRTRVLTTAVRNRAHYPKDTEPERQIIAMRLEVLTPGEWYWAHASEMYSHDGIGSMLALAGWKIIAWQPLPEAFKEETE